MKKKALTGLELNKKSISNLNSDAINGGGFSDGCTDGCTPAQTWFNCTQANCTADCTGGVSRICDTLQAQNDHI
ncbi:class I lanthipeptide [Kordia jejudonensis]|uniref:class I lanthipeptide n=1 Tax=Kordia jejudonensis TaxID=1348245 RepID=UPI00062919A5|nr:class I lanthipeptide [Kordia jejudonensis]